MGIITDFGFILVYLYLIIPLKMNLISFKKWIKIVYFLSIFHNFVLISNKTSGIILLRRQFRPVAICDLRPQRQWNWVPVAQHVQKAHKFRGIPYKFEAIPYYSRYNVIYLD